MLATVPTKIKNCALSIMILNKYLSAAQELSQLEFCTFLSFPQASLGKTRAGPVFPG